MKIQNTAGLQGVIPSSDKDRNSVGSTEFQKLLENRLRSIAEAGKVAAGNAVEQAAPAPGLKLEGLDLTETALRSLEDFEAALDNPAIKGSDLEPYVASLEEETSGLLAIREQLPADDPLAGLVDRVAAVTFLESAKYRRGDYST